MIFINRNYLIATIVIIIILLLSLGFLIYCAFFAYRMNAQLDSDDTEKKDFAHLAPWLRPATPFIWLGQMIILAPLSILFGIFLVLFPFILIIFRPLPKDDPVRRFILKVGNGVMKINTKLLLALGLHTKPIRFSA